MKTNSVSPFYYNQGQGEQPREVNNELGQDAFLKILAAQFSGQNPLEPLKDTEFIAQMAQFSSLEALHKISDKLDVFQEDSLWGQYLSLLGKEVAGVNGDGETIEGLVTGVSFKDGEYRLSIDGKEQGSLALTSVKIRQETQLEPEEELPEPEENPGEGEE